MVEGAGDDEQLRELSRQNVCPNCGGEVASGRRFPHGRGVFCSLQCVAQYEGAELLEQHRKILEALQRHRRS